MSNYEERGLYALMMTGIVLGILIIGFSLAIFFTNLAVGRPHIKLDTPTTDTLRIPVIMDTVTGEAAVPMISPDGMAVLTKTRIQLDSLRREVEVLQKYNAELIANIRQETNNSLDKINGWLAFWVATSCLVCMVVPLIAQWRNELHHKDMIEQLKREIDREKDRLMMIRNYANMQVGIEAKLLKPIEGDGDMMQVIWREAMGCIDRQLHKIIDNNPAILDEDNRRHLMHMLIQMYGYVIEVDVCAAVRNRRKLNELKDSITRLYNELAQHQHKTPDDIIADFKVLLGIAKPLLG